MPNSHSCSAITKPLNMMFTPHTLSFSDAEIIEAAKTAYGRNQGTTKSIKHSDVYVELGITRRSRLWDRKEKLISPQKMAVILRSVGFVSLSPTNGGKKAQYIYRGQILPGKPREACA